MFSLNVNLYNFPSAATLGVLAAIGLLVGGGVALWRSGKGSVRTARVLTAIVLAATGVALMAVSLHLALVRDEFHRIADGPGFGDLPSTSPVAIVASVGVIAVIVCMEVWALIRQHGLALLALTTVGYAAFAVMADTAMFYYFTDFWALANAAGWILTVLWGIALTVALAVVKIRDYGLRQYERGRLEALDTRAASPVIPV